MCGYHYVFPVNTFSEIATVSGAISISWKATMNSHMVQPLAHGGSILSLYHQITEHDLSVFVTAGLEESSDPDGVGEVGVRKGKSPQAAAAQIISEVEKSHKNKSSPPKMIFRH